MDRIKIEERKDGIYIVIDKSDDSVEITRKDILTAIEERGLKNVDFNVVSDLLKSDDDLVTGKISEENLKPPVDEDVVFEMSRDKMSATMKFKMPENDGALLTVQGLMDKIAQFGITFGIKEDVVQECVNSGLNKDYSDKFVVAEGKAPVNGTDGEIIYNHDMTGEKSQPKILGDGTVDYKEINYFSSVNAGEVLAYRVDPTLGEAGTDVFGERIEPKSGKPAPKLSKGKNTIVTEDEMELIAETSGQLVISGKSMSISPLLEIPGNVDFSTGNIDFAGSVMVAGAVLSGFSVEATGNIEVKGIVEAATIRATGSVNLYGGIMGRSKGRVESGCNIFTKFAQNATIIAKGNLKTNALLHSEIIVDGAVDLEGDNCFIAGGSVVAGEEVRAKTIGSHMGTRTEIKVGGNMDLSNRYEELRANYVSVKQQFNQLNESYEGVVQNEDVATMDAKRKALLVQLLQNRNMLRDRAAKMEEEMTEMMEQLKRTTGRVIAEKIMHSGVSVTIGSAHRYLYDDITVSVLKSVDGMIKAEVFVE
ncbi:MAG: FapA family protein [Defluviitaleaceae bacterium]|nr:FapA family protein [Defluviitaleaceae bacterium]